jgi:multidrug efflux pump subunit AcrB
VRSVSSDNLSTVTVRAIEGYPITRLLDDVKVQVDAIPNLPEQAEKPIVKENKRQSQVLWVEIYGSDDEVLRKETARRMRDMLLAQPAISKVETFGARDYEVSIEPSEEALGKYGLTFEEFTTLSPAEKERRARENPRWCKVEYEGVTGRVAGRYLTEGDCRR